MSPNGLLSVVDARTRILSRVEPLEVESCPLDDSLGRVLGEPIASAISVPPFANSAMDGFALRSQDTQVAEASVELHVVGEIQAGSGDRVAIGMGQAVRIMTGAPMPVAADAVVPFEETSLHGDALTVPSNVPPGSSVRPEGLDIQAGETLLKPGIRLTARHIALCASVGVVEARVFRPPRVAVITTGDELVEPGRPLGRGQIYNSNSHGLAAAVRSLGAGAVVFPPVRDDAQSLTTKLRGLKGFDLILTSGGVSVGDFDYVKEALAAVGSVDFWRIAMRPGKPLTLGWIPSSEDPSRKTMLLGLPGNPTSTMVTFFVFVRPAILAMMGVDEPVPLPLPARTRDVLDNRGGRETYFRVNLSRARDRFEVALSGRQDSSMLGPLAAADALARVPAEVERVEPGEWVDVFTFGEL